MRSVLLSLSILLLAGVALGEEIPDSGAGSITDFTTGTVISSTEMNTNFDNVETAVDDNASDIDTNYNLAINAVVVNGTQDNDIATNQNDINDLRTFRATCAGGSGNCTNSDIEVAFATCTILAPPSGCVIELLDETYTDVRLEVPKLVREIRAAGDNTILLGPAAIGNVDEDSNGEQDDYVMIEIKPGEGADRFDHGLWIHGFTMDGNKQNLLAPSDPSQFFEGFDDPTNASDDQSHQGIKVSDQTLIRIQGLVIEDMIVKNFMNEAIRVDRASQAVIRNNLVENMGCWDNTGIGNPGVDGDTLSATYSAWQPGDPGVDQLAAGDMDCGAWGAAQTTTGRGWSPGNPNDGYQPGVLSEGIGIEIGCHTDNVVVENNTVRYSTKLGIQTFCAANNEPNGYSPEHIKIVNNDVSWAASAGGILTLGSNFTIVEGNSVTNIKAPWLYGNTGKGISCSALGRYNRFTNNTIVNTAGVGLAPACTCGQFSVDVSPADGNPDGPFTCNAVASNNTIINPCSQDLEGFICHAISLNTSATVPPANQSEGMTLHNNKVIRPGAFTSSTYFDEGVYSNLSITGDIASGSQQVTSGSGSIAENSCLTVPAVSAPQVATTDVVEVSFNADPTGLTGYGPSATDGLAIYAYPTADNINFKVCNLTSSAISPAALTVNWRVTR